MKISSFHTVAAGVACALLLHALTPFLTAAALFQDNFESGLVAWTGTGDWGTETATVGSVTRAVTESPGAFYGSNSDSTLTLNPVVNLGAVQRPAMAFRHAYDLEDGYDFATVEVSTDGVNWTAVASYTGYQTARREQLDLMALAGQSSVRLRLRVQSDATVVKDGWRVDDIVIGDAPAPAVLQAASAVGRTSLQLDWSASAAANFASYKILRSSAAGGDWRTAHVVATITEKATTTYTDITVAPKSAYAYRILTLDNDGLHSLSNEITVQTPAGMDFPLLDDGEGGAGHWVPDATWAISDEAARSGSNAWSDSPGTDYENNLSARSLTLAAPLDLSATTHPVWTFWYRSALAGGDSAHAEVSINGGVSWTVLGSLVEADNTDEWRMARIPLDAYKSTPILLRLRLTTNATISADGVHIDDISVAEAPNAIATPAISGINPYGGTLSWAPSTHPQLHHYALYRGEGSNATWDDTPVTTVMPGDPLQHTDTGLLPNTSYSYRVYAVTTYGTYSDDSTQAAQLTTPSQTVPYADSFENGNLAWTSGSNNANPSTWAITSEDASDGDYCLTDSPLASYAASTDSYAETSVDLSGATWPILSFTDKFSLGTGDWIRLEISAAGDPTEYYYGHRQDTQSEWTQQLIDLSQWKGNSNVKIRFRIVSDGGATPGDGWFIDNVKILENPDADTPLEMPFTEAFEGNLANKWISAGWMTLEDPDAIDGSAIARSSTLPYLASDADHYLVLGRELQLPSNSHVQVTLWFRGELRYRSYLRLHYSTNGGDTWTELTEANRNNDYLEPDNWGRVQADLSSLAGQTIRLRIGFLTTGAPEAYLELEKLTIAERQQGRNLLSANASLRTVSLTWTANPLGPDFQRCELWRSTSANVSISNGQMVFSTTDPATTATTDGGLSIGGTYYYKLFTVDQRDTYIPSNELSATTVPLLLSIADPMESLDNWLIGTNNTNTPEWTVVADDASSGSGSIATTAIGQYTPSTDSYIETALNLSGTTWPVLTFWDKYDLASGDWFRVEISGTGGPTEYYYGRREGSRMEWQKQSIDLSQWKGLANVKIRFRFVSNSDANVGLGWFIDDFTVTENPDAGQKLVLPFTEDFESDLSTDWINAGWMTPEDASPVDGSAIATTDEGGYASSDSDFYMVLDREIDLAPDSQVQATFWFRGELRYRSYLRLHYSANDGGTWNELTEANRNNDYLEPGNWARVQADLSGLAGQTIRLRIGFLTTGAPASFLDLDKFTLAERPAASNLISATPGLRSVNLTWEATSLGSDFQRYELWRSTTAKVSVSNGELVFSSTNPATTSTSDGGLNIGGTYYYKLFTVDQRDTFIPSNELSTTTVPVQLPLADPLDSLGNWVIGSNNANAPEWSLVRTGMHEGTGCLAAVPVGQYAPSMDNYVETALDLTGAIWPVLTFWDKYDMGIGDWFRLEISATGGPTEYYYGRQSGTRLEWRQQAIDLSQWKGLANVKIRFRILSNSDANVGQGWFIDDLKVQENPDAALPLNLPLEENFEGTLAANWLSAGWSTQASAAAKEGSAIASSHDGAAVSSDVDAYMVLDRSLTLPANSHVQATLWFRGELRYRSYLRLYYSNNGGTSWSEVSEANRNNDYLEPDNWARVQADLSGLAGQTVRLKIGIVTLGAPAAYLELDKLTLAERNTAPTAQPIDQIATTSLRLNWLPVGIPDFQEYRIYRSKANDVSPFTSELIATLSNASASSFTDTALEGRTPYYYKVYTVDTRDSYAGSDTVSATTLGLNIPVTENFEAGNLPGWTNTGNWQIVAGIGRNGGAALVDSPGDYSASTDTAASFAVDLTGMDWPVLRFWDKFAFAGNSWGRLEISTNGTSWTAFPYSVTGTRAEWRQQQVDLSQWKGNNRLFIRFRSGTDGNIADGWTIDDLTLEEHVQTPVTSVWDTFERDSGLWLSTRWVPGSDHPKEGATCLADSPEGRYGPDAQNLLTLASELDLTEAVDPSIALYLRGNLAYRSYFRVQVSTNGGVTWVDVSGMSRSNDYSQAGWEYLSASLQTWVGQVIRLRIISWGLGQPNSSLWIDSVGIGEPAPLSPAIASPKTGDVASERRPVLTVDNAIDFQSDNLSYRFEVYGDEGMGQLVAQVPVVASGLTQTSWTVDINLTDKAPYWWRARASDGTNEGPWSATGQFFVSEYNTPPPVVPQVAPPIGALLLDSDQWLVWRTVVDTDPGEAILDYHLQIDDDPAFGSPLVDLESVLAQPFGAASGDLIGIPLNALAAVDQLLTGRWYWRVRARDGRDLYGAWPAQGLLFRIPSDFELYVSMAYTAAQQDDPMVSSPEADADADGVPLLMEFVCGMDPAVADADKAPKHSLLKIGNALHHSWTFTRRAETTAVFVVEHSTDLQVWTDAGANLEVIGTQPDGTLRCRMTDPVPVEPERFARITLKDQ